MVLEVTQKPPRSFFRAVIVANEQAKCPCLNAHVERVKTRSSIVCASSDGHHVTKRCAPRGHRAGNARGARFIRQAAVDIGLLHRKITPAEDPLANDPVRINTRAAKDVQAPSARAERYRQSTQSEGNSMSIFSSIKDAIFGHKAAAQPAPADTPHAPVTTAPAQAQAAPAASVATQPVDVETVLNEIVQQKGNPDLNWKTSIVDLMKLLGIDSSLHNREALATELNYPGAKDGSAEMNIWLHKAVMKALATNGGKVPANLTD